MATGDNVIDHVLTVLALAYESDRFNEVRTTGRGMGRPARSPPESARTAVSSGPPSS